jgi:hypothetical protein
MKSKMMSVAVLALLASGLAAAVMVDTFDSYTTGTMNTVANPPWKEAFNVGPAAATIGQETGGNQYLAITAATGNTLTDPTNAVYRSIPAITNANTATTLFLRFRAETATTNSSFGLSKLTVPTLGFGDFQVQMRVVATAGVDNFSVRNGTGFTANTPVTVGTWYNVWAVINQSTDKFDVYMTTGSADATAANLIYANNGFRTAAPTEDLVTFLGVSQGSKLLPNTNALDLDSIAITDGVNLTVPEPASMLLLALGGLVLNYRKR